ncbi:WD40-repeat-containing domain protein [Myxozyma melibiosi]|uniref:WD40-repeat-containing domain protein n=1 Tax=Myxozyma melibiosi TaxID=54550 RepID=A0ABR1F6M9_9ASCO
MDFRRCKFLDHPSHSITALAFSHSPSKSSAPKSLRLAVGRANGDIEIWNPRANWVHETTIKGGRNRSIEGLAWSVSNGDLRLFSIGGSTAVTEWDLKTGLPLEHHDCDAGIVWSIAVSPDGTKIAAGCDDGSVKIIDISGGKASLEHLRILQRQKSRVLSIAWRCNSQVVGGCADGRIRVWAAVASADVGEPNGTEATSASAVGRIIGTMRVDKAQGEQTLVWAVLVLNNGKTIVSGDSTGAVKFWDATHFSLLQSFQVHDADVLCLAGNESSDSVFSAGVDRKIVRYSIVDSKLRRWANMSSRLIHAQDIRALSLYESKSLNWLISGGVEQAIVINSVEHFMDAAFRKIAVCPQRHYVHSSGSKRLVALWSDNQVKVWSLRKFEKLPGGADTEPKTKRLVASLTLNNDENITHVALSADARYLAVATASEVKLFLLLPSKNGFVYNVKKTSSPVLADRGCTLLAFHPVSQNLVMVNHESEVFSYTIGPQSLAELDYSPTTISSDDDDEEKVKTALPYLDNINHIAFSDDGKYFALATLGGRVDIYDWPTQSLVWTLPKIPVFASAVTFCPDNDSIVVISAEMKVLQFSVSEKGMTAWSRRNSEFVPSEFHNLVDKCCGVYIEGSDAPSRLWLWGASWMATLDLSLDIPILRMPKRKRSGLSVDSDDNSSVKSAASISSSSTPSKQAKTNGLVTNGNGTPAVNGSRKKVGGSTNGTSSKLTKKITS